MGIAHPTISGLKVWLDTEFAQFPAHVVEGLVDEGRIFNARFLSLCFDNFLHDLNADHRRSDGNPEGIVSFPQTSEYPLVKQIGITSHQSIAAVAQVVVHIAQAGRIATVV